ncbi:MAG: CoA-binding protein [Candidatus Dojkabacteria bacterium]|nr:MAG: CoA-binding protein [Candidatus Dojkabacteria bacterium]
MEVKDYINKTYRYAVVGASRDPNKYGHKVFVDLKQGGYQVYPINPNAGELLGEKVYASVEECPELVDVVVMVVPASVGMVVVDEVDKLGIKKVWFQPGSESDELVKRCEQLGLSCSVDRCIMVERAKSDRASTPVVG